MFSRELKAKAKKLLKNCEEHQMILASAESCTGGLIAALLTEIPGSSAVFERGFVTYSNNAKTELLGVPAALIKREGAVSGSVAKAMAEGVLKRSGAQISVAVTGIAGPGGGTKFKPVGLVYIAIAAEGFKTIAEECRFKGTRTNIRQHAVTKALAMLTVCSNRFSSI